MTPADPLKTRAIVVGIEQYALGPSCDLDGPALDACKFARWLRSCGVPAEQIQVAVSPLPRNKAAVDQGLAGFDPVKAQDEILLPLFLELQNNSSDLLIVYWGGHGVQDGATRRLVLADAAGHVMRTFPLTAWLDQLRTTTFRGHRHQIFFVDACLGDIGALKWKGIVSANDPHGGKVDHARDQFVLYAASPGERARNIDTLKTGLFSKELRAVLSWPLDPATISARLTDRFRDLRDQGNASQTPSRLWYRDRSNEDTLVFQGLDSPESFERTPAQALFDDDRIEELKSLLQGGELPDNLVPLFTAATRLRVRRADPGRCSLDDLLIELRRQVDPLPLLEFVLRIAAQQRRSVARTLKNWVSISASDWQIEPRQLEELRRRSRLAVFLVKVAHTTQRDGWRVTAWIFTDGESRVECPEIGPVGREKLAELLQDQVTKWVDDFKPETGSMALSIEILLPIDLLDLDVETIEVMIGSNKYQIGSVCPVVVRSLDRLDDDDWFEAWLDKWDELGRASEKFDEAAISWLRGGDPMPSQLRPCAAIACAYAADREVIFRTALSAGTPLVVWHRRIPPQTSRKHALRGVLRNGGLREMPKVTLAQRIASRRPDAEPTHHGHDLVLLWDDPGRLPEEPDYHEPRTELMTP